MKINPVNILNKLIFIFLITTLTGCSVSSQHTVEGSQVVHDRTMAIIFNDSAPHVEFNDEILILKPSVFSEREVTRTDSLVTTVMKKEISVGQHVGAVFASILSLGLPQIYMLFDPDFTLYKCANYTVKCTTTSTSEKKINLNMQRISA